ncbi:MAG: FG-GAP-like repeat-containing protein [Planctomycetota bacterium]
MTRSSTIAALVCAVAALLASFATASQDRPTKLAELQGLVQSGRLEEAIEKGRAFVAADDGFAGAWHLLGYALHASGRLEEALAAHERAAGFAATASHGAYNAACACALLGRVDDAFAWLAKAKAAGFQDGPLARGDADLASLRADPRFDALFPPIDHADPFVEPGVVVLHESFGNAANDQYGWVARAIGDADGDGAIDFAASAPFANGGAGLVRAYSGRSGALLFVAKGRGGDHLGWCVGAAGDVDGDGRVDLFAGAPRAPQDGSAPGALVILSGADGRELRRIPGEAPGDRFGTSACAVGDQDGDGRTDLFVSAPQHDVEGRTDVGRVTLLSGATFEPLHTFDGAFAGAKLGDGEVAGFASGDRRVLVASTFGGGDVSRARVVWWDGRSGALLRESTGGPGTVNLGWFVSTASDVDGDGVPDVLATDWHDTASGPGAGRVWIWSGADGALLRSLGGRVAGEHFGIGACDAGDLDGDGKDDLAIGAWQHSSGAQAGGRVYLVSGANGRELGRVTCKLPGDCFGFDATSVGVDRDGVPDLLVTAAYDAKAGEKAGRTFVLSGASCLAPAAPR